jgi:hypothetical protein
MGLHFVTVEGSRALIAACRLSDYGYPPVRRKNAHGARTASDGRTTLLHCPALSSAAGVKFVTEWLE